jgi:hypothetical protein
MHDHDLVALRDKVAVVPTEGRAATRATVVAHTGTRTVEADHDTGVPATDHALQWERLSRKFRSLAVPVVGAATADEIHAAVADIESVPSVRDLLRLLV